MNKEEIVINYLNKILKDAACELNYQKDYELLLAVMFSAQTTDKRVNEVTNVLFSKYPALESYKDVSVQEIEKIIRSIGLSKTKAQNALGIIDRLITSFNSQVPSDKEELLTLPGVGVKTANVVRAELFKIPEFAVDTHVARIAKRLGFARENDNVTLIERKLKQAFLKEDYIRLHHQFIHFGRYYCLAKKPKCASCELHSICLFKG